MPLEQPDLQHSQAAAGYVELGMFLEANTELDKIDPFNRAAPEVLAIEDRDLSRAREMGINARNR